ncbi:hypothetical protein OXX79_000767 [Metschnikowia pulcherrima]
MIHTDHTNMQRYTLNLLLLLSVLGPAAADSFSDYGCYAQSDIQGILSSQGSYTYQTPSYCEGLCEGDKVAAVMNGKFCYCGSTVPSESLKVDSSNCNVACQGYGTITCGGSGYFEVFVNGDVDGSTMVVSSSSASSSSSSSSSTKATSTSSSTSSSSSSSASSATTSSSSSSSSSSPSSSSSSSQSSSSASSSSSESKSSSSSGSSSSGKGGLTTIVSTVTSSPGGSSNSVLEVTTTVGPASTSSSSNTGNSSQNTNASKKSSGVSGGTIAGAVVGSVAGVALISALVFFLLRWRKNRESEADDDFFDVGNKHAQSGFDSVPPNTFMAGAGGVAAAGSHTHKNSNTDRSYSSNNEDVFYYANENDRENYYPGNEEYGRRRLSNGSLPDMLTRNPGSLQVVNN